MKLCGTKLHHCVGWSNKTWYLPLRLDVACSPGRLHLIFEFVDSNLKQPESQHSWRSVTATRVSVTSQYDFAQSQMISGVCNDCTLMYIGNPKVHEEIWASTGSRSCVIPRKHTWRNYTVLSAQVCLGKGAVRAVTRHFPRSVHCTSSWCKGLTTATPEGASLGHPSIAMPPHLVLDERKWQLATSWGMVQFVDAVDFLWTFLWTFCSEDHSQRPEASIQVVPVKQHGYSVIPVAWQKPCIHSERLSERLCCTLEFLFQDSATQLLLANCSPRLLRPQNILVDGQEWMKPFESFCSATYVWCMFFKSALNSAVAEDCWRLQDNLKIADFGMARAAG